MTAVRIRHENDCVSQYLADVPFADLDSVIPTIKGWGIQDEFPELSGQFVYSETGAFFEIVIHEDASA